MQYKTWLILPTLSLILYVFIRLWSSQEWATPSTTATILGLGHGFPEDSPQHAGAVEFKRLVEEKSQGKLQIDIFPHQAQGSDPEMVGLLQQGQLAFAILATPYLTGLAPQLELLDLPYLFAERTQRYAALDGEFGKFVSHQLREADLLPLSMWESGAKHFTAHRSITRPSDFAELRCHVLPSKVLETQMMYLDAFPQHLEAGLLQDHLKTLQLDCQESTLSSIHAHKVANTHSHLILSHHGHVGQLFLASQKAIDALPAEQREHILQAVQAATKLERELVPQYEARYLANIQNTRPMQKIEWDAPTHTTFTQTFGPLYYQKRLDLLQFREILNPAILPFLESHIAIGLDLSFTYLATASALSIKRGTELAIEESNRQGGLLGKKWMLLLKNHSGFPQNGVRNLKALAQDESVLAIMGGMHSPVILAEMETIAQLKIPFLVPWAAATSIIAQNNPYIFRFSIRDADAGALLAQRAKQHGQNIALVLENTGWGKGNEKSISHAIAQDSSLRRTSVHWFDWGKKDFSDILRKIDAEQANTIIFVGNAPEGAHLVNSLSQFPQPIPIVSHWGITGGRFWQNTKRSLKKVELSFLQTYNLNHPTPGSRAAKLHQKYRQRYQLQPTEAIPASFGTIHAYELTHMLAQTIRESKSLSRTNLHLHLQQLKNYTGIFRDFKQPFATKGRGHEALGPEDLSFGSYDPSGHIIDVK
ncbi:MAG: TRAP transporter substrate-binding protein DctP [Zetaproteobacteria bacterium]|nr:TRAP transporter substrate-binding protein DctP [Zetaproteobacteria bacterium]